MRFSEIFGGRIESRLCYTDSYGEAEKGDMAEYDTGALSTAYEVFADGISGWERGDRVWVRGRQEGSGKASNKEFAIMEVVFVLFMASRGGGGGGRVV